MSNKKALKHPITGDLTIDYTIVDGRPYDATTYKNEIFYNIIFNNPYYIVKMEYFFDAFDYGSDPIKHYEKNYEKYAAKMPVYEYSTVRPYIIIGLIIGAIYIITKVIK